MKVDPLFPHPASQVAGATVFDLYVAAAIQGLLQTDKPLDSIGPARRAEAAVEAAERAYKIRCDLLDKWRQD